MSGFERSPALGTGMMLENVHISSSLLPSRARLQNFKMMLLRPQFFTTSGGMSSGPSTLALSQRVFRPGKLTDREETVTDVEVLEEWWYFFLLSFDAVSSPRN